jgi:hypothetical protein
MSPLSRLKARDELLAGNFDNPFHLKRCAY